MDLDLSISRRNVLALGAGGLGLTIAVDYASAASLSLSVSDTSTTTSDGTIDDIYIYKSPSHIDVDWSGFDQSPSPTFRVDVRADPNADTTNSHLIGTDATSYSHELGGGYILNSSYSGLSGTSGSASDIGFGTIYSSTTFPVPIIANHPGLSDSDFVPDTAGNTEQVILQYLVEFNDSNYGLVASETTTQTVTVEYTQSNQISGTVTSSGSAVQGATVYVVDADNNTVAGTDTSASDGSYAVSGLSTGTTYHAMAQYKDGSGNVYTDYSKPFLVL